MPVVPRNAVEKGRDGVTKSQAKALIRAADALPQEIGTGATFNRDGKPCCAIGHIMAQTGFVPSKSELDEEDNSFITAGMSEFQAAFGLAPEPADDFYWAAFVTSSNDRSQPAERRAAAIEAVDAILLEVGRDPAALRAEIAAESAS